MVNFENNLIDCTFVSFELQYNIHIIKIFGCLFIDIRLTASNYLLRLIASDLQVRLIPNLT